MQRLGDRVCAAVALMVAVLWLPVLGARAQPTCVGEWDLSFGPDDARYELRAPVEIDLDGAGPEAPSLIGIRVARPNTPGVGTYVARFSPRGWERYGELFDAPVTRVFGWDADGAGPGLPKLIAMGEFTRVGTVEAQHIAMWDGSAWRAMGAGFDAPVMCATELDEDGSGPRPTELYVGGAFSFSGPTPVIRVARWDGSTWRDVGGGLGGGGPVTAMLGCDLGLGPTLFAGGDVLMGQWLASPLLVQWKQGQWRSVGQGLEGSTRTINDMKVFDLDGWGPRGLELVIAGGFSSPGAHIVSFDGTSFRRLAPTSAYPSGGVDTSVASLTTWDPDGPGIEDTMLVLGGTFRAALADPFTNGRRFLTSWVGGGWYAVRHGVQRAVKSVVAHDLDGHGPRRPQLVYEIGPFGTSLPPGGVYVLEGGSGDPALTPSFESAVHEITFERFGSASSPVMVVGGSFRFGSGRILNGVAQREDGGWSPFGAGFDSVVSALAAYDPDDSGPEPRLLYAGGQFTKSGGTTVNGIARWNGASWQAMGDGVRHPWYRAKVEAMIEFDEDGTGPAPPSLIIGGTFATVDGVAASNVARWNGRQWTEMHGGLDFGESSESGVFCFAVHDDGTGPALYAGGAFRYSGENDVSRVAKWTGSEWVGLGVGMGYGGLGSAVYDLESLDDGSGPALYAGGSFVEAGGEPIVRIARWRMGAWEQARGPGQSDPRATIYSFTSLPVGGGRSVLLRGTDWYRDYERDLYVAEIVAWDGERWASPDRGELGWTTSSGTVSCLTTAPTAPGAAPEVYAGGTFLIGPNLSGGNIARYVGCVTCDADCDNSTGWGVLDIFDFLCFQSRFAAGAPYACDCDTSTGPNVCDVLDFLCFQSAFARGCQ